MCLIAASLSPADAGEWVSLLPALRQLAGCVPGQRVRALIATHPLSSCAPCMQALRDARHGTLLQPDVLVDGLVRGGGSLPRAFF